MNKATSTATIIGTIILILGFFEFSSYEDIKKSINNTFTIYYSEDGEYFVDNSKIYKSTFYIENIVSKEKISTKDKIDISYIDFGLNKIEMINSFIEKENQNIKVNPTFGDNKLKLKIDNLNYKDNFNIVVYTYKKPKVEDMSFIGNLGNFKVNDKIYLKNTNNLNLYIFLIIVILILTLTSYYFYNRKKYFEKQFEILTLDRTNIIKLKNEEKDKNEKEIIRLQNDNYLLIGENKGIKDSFDRLLKQKIEKGE